VIEMAAIRRATAAVMASDRRSDHHRQSSSLSGSVQSYQDRSRPGEHSVRPADDPAGGTAKLSPAGRMGSLQREVLMASGMTLGMKIGLSRGMASRLSSLRTPERIQDFVNGIPWNYEQQGPTALSVVEVLRQRRAHCIEAAFVAACGLWLSGQPPLLIDLGAARGDVDHVMAIFRRGRHWGAISKSNSPFLRYRDPIYRSLRELAVSYFPQYVKRRRKTLRTYSVPVDLSRYDTALWVTRPGFCHELVDALTGARHFDILPGGPSPRLRPIDEIEARANLLRDHEEDA